jgi:hypothetical protein
MDSLFSQEQKIKYEIRQGFDGENQQKKPDQQPENEKQAREIKNLSEQVAAEHGDGSSQGKKQQQLQEGLFEKAVVPFFSAKQKEDQQQQEAKRGQQD